MGDVQSEGGLAGSGGRGGEEGLAVVCRRLAAAACCQARRGRPVGQDGRERPAAGRGGASISYVTGPETLCAASDITSACEPPAKATLGRCCTLNDRVLSSSHPLLRPRLPVGLVGLSCTRRPQVALRRPARMAPRDDRPDRERLGLRAARLHARRPGARVPQLPRARDAVRHRAARARARHVADVPRRRRHPPPRPRARVRGLPRAAARPVHDHAVPRGDAQLREAIAWVPGIDAEAIVAAAHDPETEELFVQDRDLARSAANSPTEFQDKHANTDGRVRYTAPSIRFTNRQGGRSRPAASSPSRPTTCSSPTSTSR